jgi:hypothetical protein
MPIYRRLAEYSAPRLPMHRVCGRIPCGNLRKPQLVKHWESETIAIDIRRKVPPAIACMSGSASKRSDP